MYTAQSGKVEFILMVLYLNKIYYDQSKKIQ